MWTCSDRGIHRNIQLTSQRTDFCCSTSTEARRPIRDGAQRTRSHGFYSSRIVRFVWRKRRLGFLECYAVSVSMQAILCIWLSQIFVEG